MPVLFSAAAAFLILPPSVNAATLAGEAKFLGTLPDHRPIRVSKDQDYCGQTLPNEGYLIGPGQGLENVVVHIERSLEPAVSLPDSKENLLDNLAMPWGERLIIKNSDPKLHIVHSYSEKRSVFNISLPFQGTRMDITHKIKGPGLLQVNCDTHAWMRGYIYVFGHSFFAVTDEERGSTIGI